MRRRWLAGVSTSTEAAALAGDVLDSALCEGNDA